MVELIRSSEFSMSLHDRITFHLIRIQGNFTVTSLLDVNREFNALFKSDIRNLAIDIKDCEYLDSSALGIIINIYKKLRETGGILILLRPTPKVQSILTKTNLTQVIQVLKSLEEADEFFD